eukprot:6424100-Amphidinium_carterae.1
MQARSQDSAGSSKKGLVRPRTCRGRLAARWHVSFRSHGRFGVLPLEDIHAVRALHLQALMPRSRACSEHRKGVL